MKTVTPEELYCFVSDSVRLEAKGNGTLNELSFVVKDLISIKNHTNSFGNPRWRQTHEPSKENAPLIDRLLANGATMTGITKMDQLAYSVIGNIGEGEQPLNPLYPDRFTGGSSSGSASAVAGKIADIGIGTDTGGSVRIPAAGCGIFGIRPTHASIDTIGVIPWAQSFDVVGVLTRKASTLKETLKILINKQTEKRNKITSILVAAGAQEVVDKNLSEVALKAGRMIGEKLNIKTKTIDLSDFVAPAIADLFARIQGREIWANHHQWIEKNMQYLTDDVKVRLERCRLSNEASESEKKADERMRKEYSKRVLTLLGSGSLLVLSVLPTLIPLRTSSLETQREFRSRAVRLQALSGFSGAPEIVIPFHDNTSGITTGVGVLAPKRSDELLCQLAEQVAGDKDMIELK